MASSVLTLLKDLPVALRTAPQALRRFHCLPARVIDLELTQRCNLDGRLC